MKPELALESMQQLHWGYTGGARMGTGYGWFDLNGWKTYLDIISKLGQTKKLLPLENVATNDLIKEANNFDHARVERDAKNFKLNDTWKDVPSRATGKGLHGTGRKRYSSLAARNRL